MTKKKVSPLVNSATIVILSTIILVLLAIWTITDGSISLKLAGSAITVFILGLILSVVRYGDIENE